MLYLLEDDTGLPAHYGAQAAVLAAALGATVLHVAARFDERRFPDAVQYVTADGALVPSGLLWAERLTGQSIGTASEIADVVAKAEHVDVVVPVHAVVVDGMLADALRTLAARRSVAVHRYRVVRDSNVTRIVDSTVADAHTDAIDAPCSAKTATVATQDTFGRWRWVTPKSHADVASCDDATPDTMRRPLRIALIGDESGQRDVYPATLAALADAADVQHLHLHLRCVSPHGLDDANVHDMLAPFDGIVLPGGADMACVPGQIAAAKYTWLSCVPVVGLCLGMQSMATAIARLAMQTDEISLMEAEPHAKIPSFVPIAADSSGTLAHRLGRQPLSVVQPSLLHAMLGDHTHIRCNHRYRLNPDLVAPLATTGVEVVARDSSGEIVDAIEARSHPFFVGMQGHPELASSVDRPHPLLSAFLRAATQNT